jgi:hypothetical protein
MHKQINQLRASLMAQFPERKDVIDGALAAVLAGEHVLLIGPPGTAKSALVRCLAQVFGGSYFERLLTKFSTPEELFGPISLQALAQDRFVRITAGKLPEAEFWTGVDVPGEALSNVIIVKLPFPVPSHPLVSAKRELIESRGGNSFRDYFLPEAILKFRQGIGRLIRSVDDRGIIVVLDPRIVTTGYGKSFLRAVPDCPRHIT